MSADMKTDNSSLQAKVAVRLWLLERIDHPAVLDLYCGRNGQMYRNAWKRAEVYLGTDKRQPHDLAPTLRMSAERAIAGLNLDSYNVFDIDPYDSPWAIARKVLQRKNEGVVGMALTSGEGRGLKNGTMNEILRKTIGASGLSNCNMMYRWRYDIMGIMVRSLLEIPGISWLCGVWVVVRKQNDMFYWGLVLRKTLTNT